jgi:hypothetical protein
MWWANLLSVIRIMKALSSLLSAFMKKIAGLYRHHEYGMLNSERALPFATHIHDRSGKFK